MGKNFLQTVSMLNRLALNLQSPTYICLQMLGSKAVLACCAESSGPKEQSFAHVRVDTHAKHKTANSCIRWGTTQPLGA